MQPNTSFFNGKTVGEINSLIENMVRTVDKRSLIAVRVFCQKHFSDLLGGEMELRLVVDANIIISEMHSFVRNKQSFLHKLLVSPFIKVIAPKWLKTEIAEKIPELAKKWKVEKSTLMQAADTILTKVQFVDLRDKKAIQIAMVRMGVRDVKDVPYASLLFSVRTHGILTKDKDFESVPEIRVWQRPGIAGRVVTVFEKGSLSFFIVCGILPTLLRAFYEVIIGVLAAFWYVITQIAALVAMFINMGISALQRLPSWLLIAVLSAVLVLLIWQKNRRVISDAIKGYLQQLYEFAVNIYNYLRKLIESMAPYIKISLTALVVLFDHMSQTIDTIKELEQQATAGQLGTVNRAD